MQRAEALEAVPVVPSNLALSAWRRIARGVRVHLESEARPGQLVYTPGLVAYVAVTAGAAALLARLTVHAPSDTAGLAIVGTTVGLMAFFSIRLVSGVNAVINASSFLHLGLAISAGPVGALVGALSEGVGVGLRYRSGWFRTTFNVALSFLTDLSAWAVYSAIVNGTHGGPLMTAAAGAGAGIVHWIVNYALLSGIITIASGRPYFSQIRSAIPTSAYNVCYGYAAVGFVALHARFGPIGFTFALTPVVALQIFLIVLARRTRAHEEQRNHLLEQLAEESVRVERSYDATLVALTHALDARDKETEGHSRRVVEYTRLVAVRLDINGEALKLLCHGALLHDIGKIGVPDAILHKPGPLTEDEWQVMRRHPEIGALMVEEVEYLAEARRIILHHHERWDGRGYPLGLRGNQIALGARAFAIADTVDAITQDRPYRRGRSFDEAREELIRHRGSQFDPDAVDAFLDIAEDELMAIAAIRARVGLDLLAGSVMSDARVLAGSFA